MEKRLICVASKIEVPMSMVVEHETAKLFVYRAAWQSRICLGIQKELRRTWHGEGLIASGVKRPVWWIT
jgi:hypothetical protein